MLRCALFGAILFLSCCRCGSLLSKDMRKPNCPKPHYIILRWNTYKKARSSDYRLSYLQAFAQPHLRTNNSSTPRLCNIHSGTTSNADTNGLSRGKFWCLWRAQYMHSRALPSCYSLQMLNVRSSKMKDNVIVTPCFVNVARSSNYIGRHGHCKSR